MQEMCLKKHMVNLAISANIMNTKLTLLPKQLNRLTEFSGI